MLVDEPEPSLPDNQNHPLFAESSSYESSESVSPSGISELNVQYSPQSSLRSDNKLAIESYRVDEVDESVGRVSLIPPVNKTPRRVERQDDVSVSGVIHQ